MNDTRTQLVMFSRNVIIQKTILVKAEAMKLWSSFSRAILLTQTIIRMKSGLSHIDRGIGNLGAYANQISLHKQANAVM